MLTAFKKYIAENRLCETGDTIIAAVSGGLDSMVMAHLLLQSGYRVVVAHCNFQLRGAESLRDENFVTEWAARQRLPLHTERYQTTAFADANGLSIQEAARQLRYDFFYRLQQLYTHTRQQAWIATAHHGSDAVETFLMHVSRGTGIAGLLGIPAKNGSVIRPLLFATRQDIANYATAEQLLWVEDASNEQATYTRNFFRHQILPQITTRFPQAEQNILGTIEKLKDVAGLYDTAVAMRLRRLVSKDGVAEKVPVKLLLQWPYARAIAWEWMHPYGFTEGQLDMLWQLLHAQTGSYILSATHRIIRNRAWLVLTPLHTTSNSMQVIAEAPSLTVFAGEKQLQVAAPLAWHSALTVPALPPAEAWIDAATLQWPLLLRPWKAGDYFYPLGMTKKKKVARFLIDQKMALQEKEQVWVLESNRKIVWVIGYRIDHRFRVQHGTRQIVQLKCTQA